MAIELDAFEQYTAALGRWLTGAEELACEEHGEFACTSRACAPPPVGRGGSMPSGTRSVRGSIPLKAGASQKEINELKARHTSDSSPLWQGISKRLVGPDGVLNPYDYDRKVQAKVQSNEQIIERAVKNPQFQRGLKRLLDQPMDVGRLHSVVSGEILGDLVSDMVLTASRQGQGMTQGMPAWNQVEEGTTVRQFLERLSAGEFTETHGDNALKGLSPEVIATRILTRQFIDGWASTSNDSDPRSISKQMAAAEMHGIDYEEFYKKYRHMGALVPPDILSSARQQLEEHRDILHGLTQSEYDATQDFFKELGVKSVVLFRGVRFTGVDTPLPNKGDVVDFGSNPLSSWSIEGEVASTFFGNTSEFREGRTFAMEVPVEMIQSTTVTGRGCLNEYEVIVIGYPSEMLTIDGGT